MATRSTDENQRSTTSVRSWAPITFLVVVAAIAACTSNGDDTSESVPSTDTAPGTDTVPDTVPDRVPDTEPVGDEPEVVVSEPEEVEATALAFPAITGDAANFPNDVGPGADTATFEEAAEFAWLEFIALNWPAEAGTRDQPDTARKFGDELGGPLVWETFRSKIEVFPLNAVPADNGPTSTTMTPPPGYDDDPNNSYGYFGNLDGDAPNDYLYVGNTIAPCGTASNSTPWVNLDETNQIGLNNMYAATVGGELQDQLIRFAVKSNHTQYVYVAEQDLFTPNTRTDRSNAFENALFASDGTPLAPQTQPKPDDVVRFPGPGVVALPNGQSPGTIEIKAGWRKLSADEVSSKKFHTQKVRLYQFQTGDSGPICYIDDTWGLVSLHIMSRVASTPDYFTFATFEYADNILQQDGTSVEDVNGQVVAPPPDLSATTPDLVYKDVASGSFDPPTVNTVPGSPACDVGAHLFYVNIRAASEAPPGDICINERTNPIPDTVIKANISAHEAIRTYVGKDSVWDNYKLVNIQWKPFDISSIDSNLESETNRSTFFLANIVVETNYTLQNFSGFLDQGITSNEGSTFPDIPPNVYRFPSTGPPVVSYNMGGCMGCHGNAQVQGGADFSFILAQKIPQSEPDASLPLTLPEIEALIDELLATDTTVTDGG